MEGRNALLLVRLNVVSRKASKLSAINDQVIPTRKKSERENLRN